jgi:hypothetical protein
VKGRILIFMLRRVQKRSKRAIARPGVPASLREADEIIDRMMAFQRDESKRAQRSKR